MQINLSYGLNDKVKPIDIYKVQNNEGNVYVDNFIVYNVNMEYYKNIWYNKDTKSLEKDIVLVMLGLDRKDLLELSKKYKVVSKYMKDLDKVNEDPRFRGYMTQEQEHEFMLNGYVHEAREEGIKEGKTEGLIEKQNEVISKMLSKGMTKEEISNILEIPIEEI